MSEEGYVNYFEILGLDESAKPGAVRQAYKREMKPLVMEIKMSQGADERRDIYLLEIAKLNAALYVLRDTESRNAYWELRQKLIDLEKRWCDAAASGSSEADELHRAYDRWLRYFLARYMEEAMLEAGRDKECSEPSGWDASHERRASRLLRHYRQSLYQQILERLPHVEVTTPKIDWDRRVRDVAAILRATNDE